MHRLNKLFLFCLFFVVKVKTTLDAMLNEGLVIYVPFKKKKRHYSKKTKIVNPSSCNMHTYIRILGADMLPFNI